MQTLTVGTFNIRCDWPSTGHTAWAVRCDGARAVIENAGFDLLGVQEAFVYQADSLAIPGRWEYVGIGREDGAQEGEFAAIFYDPRRMELLRSGTFWLSETPEKPSRGWDAACTRICTWAQFRDRSAADDNPTFYFFNCHLDHVGIVAREQAVELLLQRIEALAGELPLFLVGDFNMTVEDAPLRRLGAALTDTITVNGDQHPTGTFTGFNPSEAMALPIDHIFVSGPVTVQQYTVLSNEGEKGQLISDHRPVAVRVEIGNRFPHSSFEKTNWYS